LKLEKRLLIDLLNKILKKFNKLIEFNFYINYSRPAILTLPAHQNHLLNYFPFADYTEHEG